MRGSVNHIVAGLAAVGLLPLTAGGAAADNAPAAPPLVRTITSISGYDDLADGRRLEDAAMSHPDGLAYDSAGNLYFVDFTYHIIRRVDAATRRVYTVVGNGLRGVDTGGTVAPTSVPIGVPIGVAVDRADNLIYVDINDHYVRYVNLSGHAVTAYAVVIPAHKMAVIAGDGFGGAAGGRFTGDGGPATQASFNFPRDIALDADGNAYVDDIHNLRTRRIDRTTGIITTVAGNGEFDQKNSGDGGPATHASLLMPTGVAIDPHGGMVIAEWSGRLRRVGPSGTITTIAGNGEFAGGYGGDGGPAVAAQIGGNPKCPTFDADGSVLFTDPENHRIRRIDATSGTITTVVGSGFADELWSDSAYSSADNGRHPTDVRLRYPQCMTRTNDGLLFTDGGNGAIRRVAAGTDGLINGDPTERLYDVAARGGIKQPFRLVIDGKNNVITMQNSRAQILRVDPRGRVTPLVGTGVVPFSLDGPGGDPRDDLGDGGHAIDATVSPSSGMSVSRDGDLYIADSYTHRIRRVRGSKGVSPSSKIETVATLPFPTDEVAVADERHIYVSEMQANRVWQVDAVSGRRTLVAGNGVEGLAGDGGPATDAELGCPMGLALDARARHLFVASVCTGAVREIDLASGVISTVVELSGERYGRVVQGEPVQIALLGDRFLFVTDGLLLNVHRVDLQPATRRADVVAGSGYADFPGFTGDHVPGPQSQLGAPFGLAIDGAGKLYIAEQDSQRIRRLGMVDILPGTFPNVVSRRGHELVPVALLSTYGVDARRINPASIRVAGAPVARNGDGKYRTSSRDVNGDQRPDLVVEVERARLHLDANAFEAVVTARTFDGKPMSDADWIKVAR